MAPHKTKPKPMNATTCQLNHTEEASSNTPTAKKPTAIPMEERLFLLTLFKKTTPIKIKIKIN
jgi:hypothetical protein